MTSEYFKTNNEQMNHKISSWTQSISVCQSGQRDRDVRYIQDGVTQQQQVIPKYQILL